MALPAVQFRPFERGSDPVELDPGTAAAPGPDGLALLTPAVEPLSVGEPPGGVRPALCERMATGYPLARNPVGSGEVATRAEITSRRPAWTVRWQGLTFAQRELVRAWLRDEVRGTERAFDVALDGADGETTKVRPTGAARDVWEHRTAYTVEVDVEEAF